MHVSDNENKNISKNEIQKFGYRLFVSTTTLNARTPVRALTVCPDFSSPIGSLVRTHN